LGTQQEYVVQIEHLCKRFPGVVALDDFSLDLRPGQVHALVGENGAGKSTVMKILAGILKPNEGRILFRGQPFEAKSAFDAIAKGITMIPQELDLVPDLTVAMNIFLGNEVMARGGLMQNRRMAERARKMLKDFDLDIEPTKKVSELSVAQMQMVAILKATAFDATVIIMDEPTSAITDREVEKLFQVIARLRGQGKAIIYISHKMDEIFRIADYVTVMRDGRLVGSGPIQDFTRDEIIRMMVGRELTDMFVKDAKPTGAFNPEEVILEVDGLAREHEFQDISFTLKRGEILGVAGLMGAGRTEVMETIFGVRGRSAGSVRVRGRQLSRLNPGAAIRNGIAFITEDRKVMGLNLVGGVRINITVAYIERVLRGGLLLDFPKERTLVDGLIDKLSIKVSSRDMVVGNLSGGNQQKVVVAKWLLGDPDILIMDEPTRGIDVGAKSEIYRIMDNLAKQGKAIILISSEMPELLGMSDRIIVMHEGRITGEFSAGNCSQESLMACAVGGRKP